MPAPHRFVFDVESTSTVDLKATGAAVYWAHPDTRVLCMSYKVDDGPIHRWRPGKSVPGVMSRLGSEGWRIVAHNYLFELHAWREVLRGHGWGPAPALERWDCTMARALYWGFPAGLDELGIALGATHKKDASARPLMLKMARPRSRAPGGDPTAWWDRDEPTMLEDLHTYCDDDVAAEAEADDMLPPLPDIERAVFVADGRMNLRGIGVDDAAVRTLERITAGERARLDARMAALTEGRVRTCNQTAAILTELNQLGVPQTSLARPEVAEMLDYLSRRAASGQRFPVEVSTAREILLTRQEAAKASTAKLRAMQHHQSSDGRLHGLFQYGGAGRTLRWAGRGVQPQNYPRGTLKDLDSIFAMIERRGDTLTAPDLDALIPGTVMDAVSSLLRGCLVAGPGRVFVAGDLAQIEARVVAWLAGQDDVLAVFAKGNDVYAYAARKIGSSERQLGKALTLGCGFGMGSEKFRATAALPPYLLKLTEDEAAGAVAAWRAANNCIVQFWYGCDRAFRECIRRPGGFSYQFGRVTFRKTGKAVRIVLPSGREMTYHKVSIESGPEPEDRDTIAFWGPDPKTKKWSQQRTYGGKLVENITQAVARDVLAEAMAVLDINREWPVVATIHDEVVCEASVDTAGVALSVVLNTLRDPPKWAEGLPVDAEGWIGRRYRK